MFDEDMDNLIADFTYTQLGNTISFQLFFNLSTFQCIFDELLNDIKNYLIKNNIILVVKFEKNI